MMSLIVTCLGMWFSTSVMGIPADSSTSMKLKIFTITQVPVHKEAVNTVLNVNKKLRETGNYHPQYMTSGDATGCKSLRLKASSGNFSSPNYPGKYPANVDCGWTIEVPVGRRVQLTFTHFSMEYCLDCLCDAVTIYDGDSDKAQLIKTLCNNTVPNPASFTSSTRHMYISLVSDDSMSSTGFRATFKTVNSSPAINTWGSWQEWSPCSRTCGDGVQSKIRKCQDKSNCKGESQLDRTCSQGACTDSWSDWGVWSTCSHACGGGSQSKMRSCRNNSGCGGASETSRSCNNISCPEGPTISTCGAEMTGSGGTFTSPNYPGRYPNNADCSWIIQVEEGRKISLTFKAFNLEKCSSCSCDSVSIYDGSTKTSRLMNKICGHYVPGPYTSTGRDILVVLVSDNSVASTGFKATYRAENIALKPRPVEGTWGPWENWNPCSSTCGKGVQSKTRKCLDGLECKGKSQLTRTCSYGACNGCTYLLTESSGTFTSLNYPNAYPGNTNCTWTIQAPVGKKVTLTFEYFWTEKCSHCAQCDYVLVYDSSVERDQDLIRLGCGSQPPQHVLSSSNYLLVKFITDPYVAFSGFSASYEVKDIQVTETCTARHLTNSSGTFSTPNYPNNYLNSMTCTWLIEADHPDKRVLVVFKAFNFELCTSCSCDYVELYDGSNESDLKMKRWCGTTGTLAMALSTGNALLIKFVSNIGQTDTGFEATYESVTTKSAGEWFSWGEWTPWGEWSPCSVSCGGVIFSMHTRLRVCLREPCLGAALDSGTCNIQSCPGCTHHLSELSGTFTSPNFPNAYPSESKCSWIIQAPPGKKITLVFDSMWIDESCTAAFCSIFNSVCDYIWVYDGNTENSTPLRYLCGSQNIPSPILSTGRYVLVTFTTSPYLEMPGFSATYNTTDTLLNDDCPSHQLTEETGIGSSPNFPNNYLVNQTCGWKITAEPGYKITVTFTSMHLQECTSCQCDYVAIWDGDSRSDKLVRKACGHKLPIPVESSGRFMLIYFRSDEGLTDKGFTLRIEIRNDTQETVPCGHHGPFQIIGGSVAEEGRWPWQAGLFHKGSFNCGGSVINNRYILTAAHCLVQQEVFCLWFWGFPICENYRSVISAENLYVVLGTNQRDSGVVYGIETVKVHANYDADTIRNDIGLLKLDRNIRYTERIQPICLPTKNAPVGHKCQVTGWGRTSRLFEGTSTVLKMAEERVQSDSWCLAAWKHKFAYHNPSQFCGGPDLYRNQPYKGDSGGPFTCEIAGRNYLQGIVSYVGKKAGIGAPTYTEVNYFMRWIQDNSK